MLYKALPLFHESEHVGMNQHYKTDMAWILWPYSYYSILFIYLGFYVTFNTVKVISRWVVGRAEETSTYSSSGFCTVYCRPMASNYQFSHLRPCQEPNPGLRGGRRECYHSATLAPLLTQVLTQVLNPSHMSLGVGTSNPINLVNT